MADHSIGWRGSSAGPNISKIASGLVAALALVVLVGWQFHIEALKRIMPGWVAMNPVTAIALMGSSAVLALAVGWKRIPRRG